MKSLLIDIDGVACAHAEAICSWVSGKYGISAKYEDVTSWDHSFGEITFPKAVDICYPNRSFILNMDVSFGFNEFIKKVEKIMLIKFASSRKKYCHDSTEEWIKQRIGNYETIFIDEKSKIAFDYLIDDYHVECIKAAVKGGMVFMIDRPWNNSADIREKIKHISNIKIADSFKEIENYLIQ